MSTNKDLSEKISTYRDFKVKIKGFHSRDMRYLYDLDYFTNHVGSQDNARKYFDTLGLGETHYTKIPLELANIQSGELILDIGCGRGEIVFQSAERGALAFGIDFSNSAITIGNEVKSRHSTKIKDNTSFILSNAQTLPFSSNTFSKIFLLDVVEHVSHEELIDILRETNRVIKSNGTLIIHTTQNIWTRTFGFWIRKLYSFLVYKKRIQHPIVKSFNQLKENSAMDANKLFLHINEQSPLSLKLNLLRTGFQSKVWLENKNNKWIGREGWFSRTISLIYDKMKLYYFFGNNLFAIAHKRGGTIGSFR
jgi:ubiquinone/menaquinone biosynthesis C-methylase UbiE